MSSEDIAGFIGDLDLTKVDLEVIKELFPQRSRQATERTSNGESN